MCRTKSLFFFLLFALCSIQFVESSNWDMIEDEDVLLDWLSYAKQAYYMYELEANMFTCIVKGIWKLARNWVLENPDALIRQITSQSNAEVNGGLMEKYEDTTIKTTDTDSSLRTNRRHGESRLASLLGITSARSTMDYQSRTALAGFPTGRKIPGRNTFEGELEMAIMNMLMESHPMIGAIIKLFGGIVYLAHSAMNLIKSSVVLSCVADYTYQRGAEWIYLDI